jgi:MFS family permease
MKLSYIFFAYFNIFLKVLLTISMNETHKFTPDFNRMISIVMFNTMGFFFLDYLIPVVTSQILGASGLEIGLIFAVQTLGHTISSFFVGFLTDKVKHKKTLIKIGFLCNCCLSNETSLN